MINPWSIIGAIGVGLGLFLGGFWSGYEFRSGQAAQDNLETADSNTEALVAELEKARLATQEARQRAIDAADRAERLNRENASLRASVSERAANVQITDHCRLCSFGPDAVELLRDAASGSQSSPPSDED